LCQIEPYCGDEIINLDETCDDGNDTGGDGCSAICQVEELVGRALEVSSPNQTTDADGQLTETSPSWQRLGNFADPCAEIESGQYAFDYFTLTNQTGFDQVIDIDLIPGGEFDDLFLHVYEEPFDPNASERCISGADGGGTRFNDDRLEGYAITSGASIALIVSAYDSIDTPFGYPGRFQLEITTQQPPQVDACALIDPFEVTGVEGERFQVTGRVLADGYTDLTAGPDTNLVVEVGLGPAERDPSEDERLPEADRSWSWRAASLDPDWDDSETAWIGYDEYRGELEINTQGTWRFLMRASLAGQAWTYCDQGPQEGYQEEEAGVLNALPFAEPRLLINEVDYDQEGGDIAEFIELYNPGPARVPLANLSLELVNGATNGVYLSVALNEAGDELAAGSYLVIGSPLVTDLLPPDILTLELLSAVQNGGSSPDGLRIIERDGLTYDALSYEGGGVSIEGFTEGEGVIDGDDPSLSPQGSLSRCPTGEDTDDNRADFTRVDQSTPGAPNVCP
jgi:cysteine-rich repeat protein